VLALCARTDTLSAIPSVAAPNDRLIVISLAPSNLSILHRFNEEGGQPGPGPEGTPTAWSNRLRSV